MLKLFLLGKLVLRKVSKHIFITKCFGSCRNCVWLSAHPARLPWMTTVLPEHVDQVHYASARDALSVALTTLIHWSSWTMMEIEFPDWPPRHQGWKGSCVVAEVHVSQVFLIRMGLSQMNWFDINWSKHCKTHWGGKAAAGGPVGTAQKAVMSTHQTCLFF